MTGIGAAKRRKKAQKKGKRKWGFLFSVLDAAGALVFSKGMGPFFAHPPSLCELRRTRASKGKLRLQGND